MGSQQSVVENRRMGSQEPVKHLEDNSVSNAFDLPWFFTICGAMFAIPEAIKTKSLAPLAFHGTFGPMLDIIAETKKCEREHAERQKQLLEAQHSATYASFAETGAES